MRMIRFGVVERLSCLCGRLAAPLENVWRCTWAPAGPYKCTPTIPLHVPEDEILGFQSSSALWTGYTPPSDRIPGTVR